MAVYRRKSETLPPLSRHGRALGLHPVQMAHLHGDRLACYLSSCRIPRLT
ncbi:Uncharacterised protein [Vibrio cholerae]|nr:Uncharacterised protein [Vibrio cholerae]